MPFTNDLLKYINNTFVETGTFQGETVNLVMNSLPQCTNIISIELSNVFYDRCVKQFASNPSVSIYNANSKYDLYNIIQNIESPITFWLDSHWSGTPNITCDAETICPILEELEQIKRHPIKTHTIMIDDIRLMNSSNNPYEGFPVSLDEIIDIIYEINPNYKIKFYDDYTSKNDILVAYV